MHTNQCAARVVLPAGNAGVVDWTEQFYDVLQNTVGGGKPKMRWWVAGWWAHSVKHAKSDKCLLDTLPPWSTRPLQPST
jgi:hypothetical protein